jgi:hypothetical protein
MFIPRVDKLTVTPFFHRFPDDIERFIVHIFFPYVLQFDDAQAGPTGLLGEK